MEINVNYLKTTFDTTKESISKNLKSLKSALESLPEMPNPAYPQSIAVSGIVSASVPGCGYAISFIKSIISGLTDKTLPNITENINDMVNGYEWAENYAMNASVFLNEGTLYTENSMGGGNSNTIRNDNIYADPDDEFTVKYIAIYANGSYKYNMVLNESNKNKSVDEQIKELIEKGVINEGDEIKLSQGITKKQADGSLGDIGWLPQVTYNPSRTKYGDTKDVKEYKKISVQSDFIGPIDIRSNAEKSNKPNIADVVQAQQKILSNQKIIDENNEKIKELQEQIDKWERDDQRTKNSLGTARHGYDINQAKIKIRNLQNEISSLKEESTTLQEEATNAQIAMVSNVSSNGDSVVNIADAAGTETESSGVQSATASKIVHVPYAAKTTEIYAPEIGNVDISKYIDPDILNDKNCHIMSIHDVNSPSKYYDVYNTHEESKHNQNIDYMNEQINKHESGQGSHAEYNVSVWNSKTGKTTIVKVNTAEPIELAYEDPDDTNKDGEINIADVVTAKQEAIANEIPDDLKTLHNLYPNKSVEELRKMKNDLQDWEPSGD